MFEKLQRIQQKNFPLSAYGYASLYPFVPRSHVFSPQQEGTKRGVGRGFTASLSLKSFTSFAMGKTLFDKTEAVSARQKYIAIRR